MSEKVKILVSSCEYGNYAFSGHVDETVHVGDYEIRNVTHTDDRSIVPKKSMHPRMYGKINKMMNWVLYPDYDYYVWRDSRIFFKSHSHVVDFVSSLKKDVGFFKHRFSDSIEDEIRHVVEKKDSDYIKTRYSIDVMKSQVDFYLSDNIDQKDHFEGGLFVFSKNLISNSSNNLMRHWLSETMMWAENDQISLPYSIFKTDTDCQVFEGSVLNNKWTSNNYKGYK